MSASLLPNGKQQFIDANGLPLAAGLVYFYIPSTTTPKDTWQDAAQSILNTNPVLLDASGQAVIYGNGTYRQIVKDSLGNTIWDQQTQEFANSLANVVIGPSSATANAIARFNGTTGKIIKNSVVIVDDTGNITGVVGLTMTGNLSAVAGIFSGGVSGTTGTFSGAVTAAGLQPLTLTYVDAGATNGPVIEAFRDSVSPAANDQIGVLRFTANDSTGAKTIYAQIGAQVDVPTNPIENGTLNINTSVAGTLTQKASFFNTGFAVSGTASALIDPDGAVPGASLSTVGQIGNLVTNNVCMFLGRSNSGSLVDFHTAGATKGTISEAGGTVTYGAFCGAHWGQFDDGERREILPGTILETIDEMCTWLALSFTDHTGETRLEEKAVPAGAKVGDAVDYSYVRDEVIQVEVDEMIFDDADIDGFTRKNGTIVMGKKRGQVPVFDMLPVVDGNGIAVMRDVQTIVQVPAEKAGADDQITIVTNKVPEMAQVQRTRKVMQDKTIKVLETVKAKVIGQDNLTLPKIRISATAGSRRVYGVFSHWDDDDDLNNDLHSASLGAKFIRIAKGVTVEGGDLIESNGDGCGRVQADDLMRSSTVGKVTAAIVAETYPDGSYIVPCTIHAG